MGAGNGQSTMSLGEFRGFVRQTDFLREECLAYRKSFADRWDYNAVAGILIGSDKRHKGGAMHTLEYNIGIGQGDNGNHVVAKLQEKGLQEIFQKYQTAEMTGLAEVRQDIQSAVPDYVSIFDHITELFCGGNKAAEPESAPTPEKTSAAPAADTAFDEQASEYEGEDKKEKSAVEICRKCGTTLPAYAKFCFNCGEKVEATAVFEYHEEEESKAVSASPVPPESAPTPEKTSAADTAFDEQASKSGGEDKKETSAADTAFVQTPKYAGKFKKEKSAVEICRKCGTTLPVFAEFCPNCREKIESAVTFQYHEEEEAEFAFHTEYYVSVGCGHLYHASDWGRIFRNSCSHTWQDGTMYGLYYGEREYLLKIAEDGTVLDMFNLGKEHYRHICSNKHGIFLVDRDSILWCDFQGNRKKKIVFRELFGEENHVNDYYIFGTKVYIALSAYEVKAAEDKSGLGICVQSYDLVSDQKELVWSLAQGTEEAEEYIKNQVKGMIMIYGDKDIKKADQLTWTISGEPRVYANSQYAVITFSVFAYCEDYETETYSPILLLDFQTGICIDIKGTGNEHFGIRLDLRRNKMWLPEVNGMFDFGREIELEQYEVCRSLVYGGVEVDNRMMKCFFDGEHIYRLVGSDGYWHTCQKDGSCEAILFSHPGTADGLTGVGPYVCVEDPGHDDEVIFKHSIDTPKERFFQINEETKMQLFRKCNE